MNKITFITSHHWDSKRQGGFHKFAEYTANQGIETVFFSFPRPYYGYFMKREQLNKDIIKKLSKGVYYSVDNKAKKILNVTLPTLRLPDCIGNHLPDWVSKTLAITSLQPFSLFCKKYLRDTDVFVFESNESVYLLRKIKKHFPKAKIVYRPSDPMVFGSVPERLKKAEQQILYKADITLIVNEEGLIAYRKSIPDFDSMVNYQLLSNGVDIESYKKTYPVPNELNKNNTFLYVGAWEVEWNLIFQAAEQKKEFNFIIVCPNYPADEVLTKLHKYDNITYIPGIKPSEVPAWITNCDVVMVPYVTDFYKDRPLGITAKYYQAMAAQKSIIAYCDTPKLKDIGITVTYTYENFIGSLESCLKKSSDVSFDLKEREWATICKKFEEFIK